MGFSRYEKAVALLKDIKGTISNQDLRMLIIKNIGANEKRTIQPYLNLMIETKLIKDIGGFKWKIIGKKL